MNDHPVTSSQSTSSTHQTTLEEILRAESVPVFWYSESSKDAATSPSYEGGAYAS